MAALQKIPQLDGLAVAPVAPEMLEQMRGGRKVLWQMKKADPELENAKNIRFITCLLYTSDGKPAGKSVLPHALHRLHISDSPHLSAA